ncbi:hypothetical protein [Chitinolyticbacter meiyuanensis]|uniref:hypothetical protein n=1 Tax=Chitinolyticbacter meiyuanensis TaxID=682798 RepID=UPI0011E5F500|nr:hypothetical protein [Chitinolyticbacter meiyuanensis]
MSLENWLKILAVAGAICSFLWGVYQWRDKSMQELEVRRLEAERLAETRRIEATKPFLDRQLTLYSEATKVASQVATLGTTEAGKKARTRFWELYWGELALVENRTVEAAMKRMGDALAAGASEQELQLASLAVARACRESLDKSWGVNAWAQPDEAAPSSERAP